MERGYIKIEENSQREFVVEAELIGGNLWLSEHEIADLFNVFVSSVGNTLRAIFKSGVLRKENVSRIHTFKYKGHKCETTLYNLETLIFVSYRIASFEARAFREWVMKALSEYTRENKAQNRKVLVIYNSSRNLPSITSLN